MDRPFEAIPSTPQQSDRPRDSKESRFLNAIRNMNSWVRAAIAALGLLWAAGCAHTPKLVPPSQTQPERQICILWKNVSGEKITNLTETVLEELNRYLSKEYRNIQVKQFQEVAPRRTAENNLAFAIENRCDDMIGVEFSGSIERDVPNSTGYGSPKDIIMFNAQTFVYNIARGAIEIEEEGSATYSENNRECGLKFISHGSAGGEYRNECSDKIIPGKQLVAELSEDIGDLFEDDLLTDYHPEQLPPLSLMTVDEYEERKIFEAIESALRQFSSSENPIDDTEEEKFIKLADNYGKRFPNSPRAPQVKKIAADVQEKNRERRRKAYAARIENVTVFKPGENPNRPSADFNAGASMAIDMAVAAVPGAMELFDAVVGKVEKMNTKPGNQTVAAPSPSNGEIEVETGATGYLSIPCTDTGSATRIGERQDKTCTTFSGPACVIPNLSPGKYLVKAERSGGCEKRKAGPVEVEVKPGERIKVDFSRKFAR